MWYLRGVDKLEQFRGFVDDDNSNEIVEQNAEIDANSNKLFYPPVNESIVAKMCKYLKANKRIPMSANRDKSKSVPRRYIPTEKKCPFCDVHLSKPIRITAKATVITMDFVISNAETYFVKCTSCEMCFRYQEHNEAYIILMIHF